MVTSLMAQVMTRGMVKSRFIATRTKLARVARIIQWAIRSQVPFDSFWNSGMQFID